MSYSQVVWLPNALILTALLGVVAYWRWRRAGALVGLRWTGVALLPLALYGIGVFQLAWRVGVAFSRFFSGFVFRPSVWFGLILIAVALILIVVPTRVLRARSESSSGKAVAPARGTARPAPSRRRGSPDAGDDDMSEIQEILNRHGLG